MRIILKSTNHMARLVDVGASIDARIWTGETHNGTPIIAYIASLAVQDTQDQAEFEKELEQAPHIKGDLPGVPLRLVL